MSDPDGDISTLTVPFEATLEPLRFDRRPDTPGPDVLKRLCGGYAMGPIKLEVTMRGENALSVTLADSPPFELQPLRE